MHGLGNARWAHPIPHSKPLLQSSDLEAVASVLRSGQIASGHQVEVFERGMAHYIGREAGLATSSGTSALAMALRIVGVGASDDVVMPTYVCDAVRTAIRSVGARPVYCDSGPDWNPTAETVSRVITPRTKAIVAVHLFGVTEDSLALSQLEIPVVHDCCQTLSPSPGPIRSSDSLVVLSFHATKCLTTGEGGMVVGDAARLSAARKLLRQTTASAPMTDIQAALGSCQLEQYPSFVIRRKALAQRYFEKLDGLPVQLPSRVAGRSMFFRFPVVVAGDGVPELASAFLARGVHVRRGVDALLHREEGLSDAEFPQAAAHFRETISLPLYPALTDQELDYIVAVACEVLHA